MQILLNKNIMIGIIGSGFGLYGYLPAVVRCTNDDVLLLERYKEKFEKRLELADCRKRITWAEDEHFLLSNSKTIIFALPPIFQMALIEKCLKYPNIKNIIIEKPLAISPDSSDALLKVLLNCKKVFRVGYTFQYIDWGRKLFEILVSERNLSKIKIEWFFMAHHYKHNLNIWKRYNNLGGSVIRFYGIHLIALSTLLGYDNVNFSNSYGLSENDIFKWESIFENVSLPLLDISINSKSDKQYFSVKIYSEDNSQNSPIFQIDKIDPFINVYNSQVKKIDPRVDVLTYLIESLIDVDDNLSYYNLYSDCNKLWHKIEKCNINNII